MIPLKSQWASEFVTEQAQKARQRAAERYRAARKQRSVLRRIQRRLTSLLAAGAIVVGGQLVMPTGAVAGPGGGELPTGGEVVAGAAVLQTNGTTMDVNATTNRSIVEWQTFDIGSGHSVDFNLPDVNSAILNRVVGDVSSTIAGQISSNGNVYLVNPNGILVTESGVVNTNGFTASTMNINNADFMDGKDFFQYSENEHSVVNHGEINGGSGNVRLLADLVTNTGLVESNGGYIAVAGGRQLEFESGLVLTQASNETIYHGISPTAGLIKNTGTIRATGAAEVEGRVYLVNPRGDLLHSGTIEAGSLLASHGDSDVTISGKIETVDGIGIMGGDVVLNADLSATGEDGQIAVMARGSITGLLEADETVNETQLTQVDTVNITTGSDTATGGDVLLASDITGAGGPPQDNDEHQSDNAPDYSNTPSPNGGLPADPVEQRQGGHIEFANNLNIQSHGGDITLGGGNEEGSLFATSVHNFDSHNDTNNSHSNDNNTTSTPTSPSQSQPAEIQLAGIELAGSVTLESEGGDIALRGMGQSRQDEYNGSHDPLNYHPTNSPYDNSERELVGVLLSGESQTIRSGEGQVSIVGTTYSDGGGYYGYPYYYDHYDPYYGNDDSGSGVIITGTNTTIESYAGGDAIQILGDAGEVNNYYDPYYYWYYGHNSGSDSDGLGVHLGSGSTKIAAFGEGGAVTVSGYENNTAGDMLFEGQIDIIAQDGPIFIGRSNSDSTLTLNGNLTLGSKFAAPPTIRDSSSDIKLQFDNFDIQDNQRASVLTTGSVELLSSGSSFLSDIDTSWLNLAQGFGMMVHDVTIGQPTNTSAVTIGTNVDYTGNLSVYGSEIVAENKTIGSRNTESGQTLLKSTGGIRLSGGYLRPFGAGKVDTILWADSDGNKSGSIQVTDGQQIQSSGGHIWLGGGLESSEDFHGLTVGSGAAWGEESPSSANGIEISGLLRALGHSGGEISVYGASNRENGVGVALGVDATTNLQTGEARLQLRSHDDITMGVDGQGGFETNFYAQDGSITIATNVGSNGHGSLAAFDKVTASSNGGNIHIGGGQDALDYAQGGETDDRFTHGLWFDSGVFLNSSGGDIELRGRSGETSEAGKLAAGVVLGGSTHGRDSVTISAGDGSVFISGTSVNTTAGAYSVGLGFNGYEETAAESGNTSIRSAAGGNAITLIGDASEASVARSGNARGLMFRATNNYIDASSDGDIRIEGHRGSNRTWAIQMQGGNVYSNGGEISFETGPVAEEYHSQSNSQPSTENKHGILALFDVLVGAYDRDGVTPETDVIFQTDQFDNSSNVTVQTAGRLTMEPYGHDFRHSDGVFQFDGEMTEGDFKGAGDAAFLTIPDAAGMKDFYFGNDETHSSVNFDADLTVGETLNAQSRNITVAGTLQTALAQGSGIELDASDNLHVKETGRVMAADESSLQLVGSDVQIDGRLQANDGFAMLIGGQSITSGKSSKIESGGLAVGSIVADLLEGEHTVQEFSASGWIIRFLNSDKLTLAFGPFFNGAMDIDGQAHIATTEGDLIVDAAVKIGGEEISGPALILNAGQGRAAGDATGGDVILTDSSSVSVDHGTIRLFTGSLNGTRVGQEGIATPPVGRYGADETTKFAEPLDGDLHVIYREPVQGPQDLARDTNTRYDESDLSGRGIKNTVQRIGSNWISNLTNWESSGSKVDVVGSTQITNDNGQVQIKSDVEE